jgi:hypothetical protein
VTSGELEAAPPHAHPPALPGTPSVDDSYAQLVASLPHTLRELAGELPWKLGLTSSRDAGWAEFVGLHPNRELPLYAAQDLTGEAAEGGLCLPPRHLALFVSAHHLGGFFWLLRDRLRDGQVGVSDGRFLELARLYGTRWRESLVDASGDPDLADLLVRGATSRWRRGTLLERRALEVGDVHPTRYAAIIRDKLSWIAVPSQALILTCGAAARLGAFLRAHDLFMLGLQVIDDVIDREEDRALRGCDVPAALHCSPGGLLRVAPKLASRAAAIAAAGGFTWLSSWLDAFRDAILSWRLEGDGLGDELEAIGVAGEMEEALDDAAGSGERARPTASTAPASA